MRVWVVDDGSRNRDTLAGAYGRWADQGAAAHFKDGQVRAVSGSIGVLNAPTNLLTRLIHRRYRLRFQVERPAQGFFDSLLCCSGQFAVYRRSLLAELWHRYLTQTFAGVRCTNGGDLHLTNLVLATGHSRHPYLALDVLARTLLPLLLATAAVLLVGKGILVGWELLAPDLVLALATLASSRWETR
jgi:hypothetical protein